MCWNLCWDFCRIIFRGCSSLSWSIHRGTPRMQFKRKTQEQMKVLPMILPNPLWHGWNLMTWSHCAAGQHRLQEAERTKQERTNAKLGHIIMWPRFLQRLAPPHLPLRHWIWLQKMSKRGVIPRLMSQVKLENWRGNMVVFFGERSWEWCSFFWMNYRNVVARVVSVFVWLWWTSMISLLATWMEEFLHIM